MIFLPEVIPRRGFSIPLYEPGRTGSRTVRALGALRVRIGSRRYGIQGGDAGTFIAPEMPLINHLGFRPSGRN